MEMLTAKFDMSEKDLRAGSTLYVRTVRRSLILAGVLFLILAGIDVFFHFTQCCRQGDLGERILAKFELAIALGVAFYLLQRFVLIPKLARKRLRQDPVFYNGIEVEIDERGFRVRSTKTQSDWLWIDLIGTIVFLLPATAIIGWVSWPLFYNSYVIHEISNNAGGLVRWPVKLVLPVGFFLLTLQGISEIIKRIAALTGTVDRVAHYEKPLQ